VQLKFSIQIGGLFQMPGVAGAVEFNRQLCFGAEEIRETIANRMLAAKFEAGGFSISEARPQKLFGLGRAFAQASRLVRVHRIALTLVLSLRERSAELYTAITIGSA